MAPIFLGGVGRGSPRSERMSRVDPLHVAARRVLLDVLDALEPHNRAVVVAGAQAVYLRTGDSDMAVAPFTTDGDLAIDPELLSDVPTLELALGEADFDLKRIDGHVEPGVWLRSTAVEGKDVVVPVDLIVPEGAAPTAGRRGARLGVHGSRAARRAVGLEAALVDHGRMSIAALDPLDPRVIAAEVAGPAALLVAKAHKIHDRVESGKVDRVDDKDALDVLRLMQVTSPADVGATMRCLFDHPVAGAPTKAALAHLASLFGRRGGRGVRMAADAARMALPADRVAAICVAYASELVAVTDRRPV